MSEQQDTNNKKIDKKEILLNDIKNAIETTIGKNIHNLLNLIESNDWEQSKQIAESSNKPWLSKKIDAYKKLVEQTKNINENDEKSLRDFRIIKMQNWINRGDNPYKYKYNRTHMLGEIIKQFEEIEKRKENSENVEYPIASLAGRIISKRKHGKITFFDIRDTTGQIQICFNLVLFQFFQYIIISNQ